MLKFLFIGFVIHGVCSAREMTCTDLRDLLVGVQQMHIGARILTVKERSLTLESFGQTLREDLAGVLDPQKNIFLVSEVQDFKGYSPLDLANDLLLSNTCSAENQLYERYKKALLRSLSLLSPKVKDAEDLLRGEVEVLADQWAHKSVKDRQSLSENLKSWAQNDEDLINKTKISLGINVYDLENNLQNLSPHPHEEAYDIVREQFDRNRVTKFNKNEIFLDTAKVLIHKLDAHSQVMDQEEYANLRLRINNFIGIGATLVAGFTGVYISNLVEGGPAQRSGLIFPKDKIVEVDHMSIAHTSLAETVRRIKGQQGSKVTLGIERLGQYVEVTLVRDVISDGLQPVQQDTDQPSSVGYLRTSGFSEGEGDVIRTSFQNKIAHGAKSLVLDLRDNGGGLLNEAIKTIGDFVFKKPFSAVYELSTTHEGVFKHELRSKNAVLQKFPLIILINSKTASASEIVSGTLQAYGQALVLGSSASFGKGSVQQIGSLAAFSELWTMDAPDGALRLTSGLYFLANGQSIQNVGIQPDILLYPESVNADVMTEAQQPNALPQPRPLTAKDVPETDDLTLFQKYQHDIAPIRQHLAEVFQTQKSNLLQQAGPDGDVEKLAAFRLAQEWAATLNKQSSSE